MKWEAFAEPSVVIALLGALGIGAVLLEVVRGLMGRRKTGVDINSVSIESAAQLVRLHDETTAKMAADMKELRDELATVNDKLDQVLDVVAHEKRWARVNGHVDAPVLQLHKIS